MPLPFDVIIAGRFDPRHVITRWSDAPRETNPEIESLIEREWGVRVEEARRRGAELYNGDLARYVSHELRDDGVTITVGPTCYRDFVGTNLYHADLADRFGWACLANPIGTTATIITADGHVALGRRSHRVAFHAGYLHTIGGSLEAADRRPDGTVDAAGSVLRELEEEIAITPPDIRGFTCVGLVRDHEIRQPELLFEVEVSLDRSALLSRAASATAADEHTSIEFCPAQPDAVAPFIRSAAPVAPVAVAALLTFGEGRWKQPWLSETIDKIDR